MEALETTYEQQADNFLTKTNTTFKSEFVKYDYYFEGDKEKRNVFGITLFKSNHQYKFNFGSSIADSCKFVKAPITEVKKEIEVFAGLGLKDYPVSGSVKFKLFKNSDFLLSEEELTKLADQMTKDYNTSVNRYNDKINKKYTVHHRQTHRLNLSSIEDGAALQHIQKKIKEALNKTVEIPQQKEAIKRPTAYDVLACLTKYPVDTFEDFCADYGYDEDSRKAYKTYEAVKSEWQNVAMLWNETELEELREIQ